MTRRKKCTFKCIQCSMVHSSIDNLIAFSKAARKSCCLKLLHQCPHCLRYFETVKGRNCHIRADDDCRRKEFLLDEVSKINVADHFESRSYTTHCKSNCTKRTSIITEDSDNTLSVTQSFRNVKPKKFVILEPSSPQSSSSPISKEISDALSSPKRYLISLDDIESSISSPNIKFSDTSISRAKFFTEFIFKNNEDRSLDKSVMSFKSIRTRFRNLVADCKEKNLVIDSYLPRESTYDKLDDIDDSHILQFLNDFVQSGSWIDMNAMLSEPSTHSTDEASSSQDVVYDENIYGHGSFVQEEYNEEELQQYQQNEDPEEVVDDNLHINLEMDKLQEKILQQRFNKEQSYTGTDKAMIRLHNLLKEAGSPSYLFDKIIKWTQRNSKFIGDESFSIPSKDKFLKQLESRLYTDTIAKDLKPRLEKLSLSESNYVSLTSFSFEHQMISLLTNERLMQEDNLLLNCDDPFNSVPPENCMLDDVNSGWWYRETHAEICTDPTKEVLLPLMLFIDGGKVTERLSLEPIVFTLGIFNRETRNKPDAWRTLGYIEGANNYSDASYSVNERKSSEKWEEYHKIVARLIQNLTHMLGKDGGFEWTLHLNGRRVKVIFKLAIQLILGDCEGHKKLCLHFGTTNSKCICRSCHVPAGEAGDPDHICIPITNEIIQSKSPNELSLLSKHPVPNAFHPVYFGARKMSIYQSTPPEPLHGTLLGIVMYMSKHFFETIGDKLMAKVETFVRYFVRDFSSQTLRDYPSLQSVQNNMRNPGTLSATEQYNRLFALYIAVLTPHVYHNLVSILTIEHRNKWIRLFERTLAFYQWLMKVDHPPSKIKSRNGREALAQIEVRKYLTEYKFFMQHRKQSTGVNFYKFHSHLHYVENIDGHGSVQNWDTGRPESNAISHYKRNVTLTQRRQTSLSLQISIKHYEDLIMREASEALGLDKDKNKTKSPKTSGLCGSNFLITNQLDENVNADPFDHVTILWNGKCNNTIFPESVTVALCQKLFQPGPGDVFLDASSEVKGKTEYLDESGNRYRAHPNYNGKPWFDWCYVKWDEFTDEYPCKIITFLDMTDGCVFINNNGDEQLDNNQYLDNREWVVIHSGEDMPQEELNLLFSPSIGKWYNLPDCYRIVPVSSIVRPAYCIPDKVYDTHWNIKKFVAIDRIRTWSSSFLEES